MQKVFCFSGQIESGKDMAAKYLTQRLGTTWRQVAFGDNVKRVLAENFGITREDIEEWKRKDEVPPEFDMTIRRSLMWIGDGFRQIRASIWIDKLFENNPSDNLVISDGRYLSEVAAVHDRGGINIAIYRPGHGNDIDHPSEAQLKPYIDLLAEHCYTSRVITSGMGSPFDFFLLNNSSLDDLYDTIEDTLLPFINSKWKRKEK